MYRVDFFQMLNKYKNHSLKTVTCLYEKRSKLCEVCVRVCGGTDKHGEWVCSGKEVVFGEQTNREMRL